MGLDQSTFGLRRSAALQGCPAPQQAGLKGLRNEAARIHELE